MNIMCLGVVVLLHRVDIGDLNNWAFDILLQPSVDYFPEKDFY